MSCAAAVAALAVRQERLEAFLGRRLRTGELQSLGAGPARRTGRRRSSRSRDPGSFRLTGAPVRGSLGRVPGGSRTHAPPACQHRVDTHAALACHAALDLHHGQARGVPSRGAPLYYSGCRMGTTRGPGMHVVCRRCDHVYIAPRRRLRPVCTLCTSLPEPLPDRPVHCFYVGELEPEWLRRLLAPTLLTASRLRADKGLETSAVVGRARSMAASMRPVRRRHAEANSSRPAAQALHHLSPHAS